MEFNDLKDQLFLASGRAELYDRKGDRFVFQNPLFTEVRPRQSSIDADGDHMRLRDFLASMPSFADFTDNQLLKLEQNAKIIHYNNGDVIFKQGEVGENFYVIHRGSCEVCIQASNSKLKAGDIGKVCNNLREGMFFGERALMTTEKRAASIRVSEDDTVCLVFSKDTYEEVISNSNALIGKDINDNVDWSKDHETRSLFKHINSILAIHGDSNSSDRVKHAHYELTTAFTPELSVEDIISRMVISVKTAVNADRVGLFVLTDDRKTMILKVSERSKGVRLPVKGLAGICISANEPMNIPDAYKDSRFDSTMDRRSGYRTKQVMCVPVRHPVTGDPMGTLQVNNRQDGKDIPFSDEDLLILELAASQLCELLHGRADVFIHYGTSNAQSARKGSVSSIAGPKSSSGHLNFNEEAQAENMTLTHSATVDSPFQVELMNLTLSDMAAELLAHDRIPTVEITISLHFALQKLCPSRVVTVEVPVGGRRKKAKALAAMDTTLHVDQVVEFDISVCNLPRATRILFSMKGIQKKNMGLNSSPGGEGNAGADNVFIGWAATPIFDFKGCLDSMVDLRLFSSVADDEDKEFCLHTTLNNDADHFASNFSAVLCPDLIYNEEQTEGERTQRVRVIHTLPSRTIPLDSNMSTASNAIAPETEEKLNSVLLKSMSPVASTLITADEQQFIWEMRYNVMDKAHYLPVFIQSIQWDDSEKVQELYDLLDLWEVCTPVQALQLLDRRFLDPKIRAYAVHCLEDLNDEDLSLYMLQLCQQLKFENHVDSALSRFLLRRSLKNLRLIGHIFFWFLQSEVYNLDVRKRFITLLQIYLRKCEHHRIELGHQMFVMRRLESVAEKVVSEGKNAKKRLEILHEQLRTIVLPPEFQLPLNPHIKIVSIVVEKCRVMESKKKPLWLTLKDTENRDIVLMLKVGDDLRQDALILQLLKVMDSLWKKEGLDMQLQLYGCISTGFERGLLQVVLNAQTLAGVLKDAQDSQKRGGKAGSMTRKLGSAMKAWSGFTLIKEWIWQQVCFDVPIPDTGNEQNSRLMEDIEVRRRNEMDRRTQSFMISTAGYCVASYVLGLGDRHNDNLMLTAEGNFFHIDFGHILGNFKSKFGFKRERAPFVFTPAMKAVMREPDQYNAFIDLCCDIYNILRDNATLLLSLVSLAIPCKLPELQEESDILWMFDKLCVGYTYEEANIHFRKTLDEALACSATRLNDAVHMLAHA